MLQKILSRTSLVQSSRLMLNRSLFTSSIKRDMFNVQDEDDFKERVLGSKVPIIVDFHARWCGPCKILAPRIEKVVSGREGKVNLAKVDIDELSDLALEYDISAVPSVISIKDGKVIDKFVGLQEENRIESFINKLLEK